MMMLYTVLGALLLAVAGTQAEVSRIEPASRDNEQDSQQVVTKDNGWQASQQAVMKDARWPPRFCHGLDCPEFTVLNKTDDWEIRQYGALTWVSTALIGEDYIKARHIMYHRLFDYISGKNEKEMKLPLTTPVTMRIIPGPGPIIPENNFTMAFFIPPSIPDPPLPIDPTLEFQERSTGNNIYVRSFGGHADLDRFIAEAGSLTATLPESAKVVTSHYFIVQYDSPLKFWHCHNEIWFFSAQG